MKPSSSINTHPFEPLSRVRQGPLVHYLSIPFPTFCKVHKNHPKEPLRSAITLRVGSHSQFRCHPTCWGFRVSALLKENTIFWAQECHGKSLFFHSATLSLSLSLSLYINQYKDSTGQLFKKIIYRTFYTKNSTYVTEPLYSPTL